ncbi:MAG: hypothetical protein QM727_13930 [Niabella sp.]
MKVALSMIGILAFVSLMFVSCSKDDNPADNNMFVGTYRGDIGYSGGDKDVSANGSVTVVKVGSKYNFVFSDGIPDITGVEFKKDGEFYINVGGDELSYIRVNASTLKILYLKDGERWTANATR